MKDNVTTMHINKAVRSYTAGTRVMTHEQAEHERKRRQLLERLTLIRTK